MRAFALAFGCYCVSVSASLAQQQAAPAPQSLPPPQQRQSAPAAQQQSPAQAQEQTAPTQNTTPFTGDAPFGAPPVLGDQLTFSQATAEYDAKDYVRAYDTFLYLAERDDDVAAIRNVGLMKRYGQGTPRDPAGAIDYLRQAAEDGLPTAQADLGEMLLNGEAGPPDPRGALPWLEAAAKAHHPVAAFRAAEIYERGVVVARNVARAEELYAEAAERGVPQAANRLALLRSGAVSAPRP